MAAMTMTLIEMMSVRVVVMVGVRGKRRETARADGDGGAGVEEMEMGGEAGYSACGLNLLTSPFLMRPRANFFEYLYFLRRAVLTTTKQLTSRDAGSGGV